MRLSVAGRTGLARLRTLRFGLLAFGLTGLVGASIGAGAAGAAPITVGSPLSGAFTTTQFMSVGQAIDTSLPESGAHVTSPVTGTVVRWRVTNASGGPLYLALFTPGASPSYTATAISKGEVPNTLAIDTFKTDLPIKAGQTIGLENSQGSDTVGLAYPAGATFAFFQPAVAVGGTADAVGPEPGEVGFDAVVEPLPAVTHLSSHSGSTKGGKKVTIKGKNFDGTTKVKFGSTKARKFKVKSDTRIVAVAPAHHSGAVRVVVFNPGKSAASKASKFRFKKPA